LKRTSQILERAYKKTCVIEDGTTPDWTFVDQLNMKKLQFILVVILGLGFSLEAFSEIEASVESQVKAVRDQAPDMNQFQSEESSVDGEGTFTEDEGVDITNDELENTFMDALASI